MRDSGKKIFGANVRRIREALGLSQEALASDARLDRSYMGGVERGERNPSLAAILDIAQALHIPPHRLFQGIQENLAADEPSMAMTATERGGHLIIGFRYDRFDAEYELSNATRAQYDTILNTLKAGLSGTTKRADAVSHTFLAAVAQWPNANPSDLWTFLINRVYCDRANHPPANARLNLEQSWKRTGGWALERVLVNHYDSFLKEHSITVKIGNKSEKTRLLGQINDPRIIPDKADILVLHNAKGLEQLLGIIHVKASLAERRTDDVPMSQALINAGYLSIFWTMDCKSFPAERPMNRGEFGEIGAEISDKRRDFEEHAHFSACFSYNKNTIPTSEKSGAPSRIYVCNFANPNDRFTQFLINESRYRLAASRVKPR